MEEKLLIFEAEDCNDENWNEIIKVLRKNLKNFQVLYADGNYMNFRWSSKNEQKTRKKI